jgi:hypothetical protein
MPGTSIINRIAMHATASTALPTLPAAGSNIAVATWTSAGFETLGGRNSRGDDYDFDEESIDFMNVTERFADISAPLSDGIDDRILVSRKLEPMEFTLYDLDTAFLSLDSAVDVTSGVMTWDDPTAASKRTVAIEIHGKGVFYFPACYVSIKSIGGAYVDDGAVRTIMTIQPINTTALPNGGFSYNEY